MSLVGFLQIDDHCEKTVMSEAILFLLNLVLMVLLCKYVLEADKADIDEPLGPYSYMTQKRREQ